MKQRALLRGRGKSKRLHASRTQHVQPLNTNSCIKGLHSNHADLATFASYKEGNLDGVIGLKALKGQI